MVQPDSRANCPNRAAPCPITPFCQFSMAILTQIDEDALCQFAADNRPGTAVEINLDTSKTSSATLSTRLLIAGFIDVKIHNSPADTDTSKKVTARLPSYENGSSLLLNDAPSNSAWTFALMSSAKEDTRAPIIDEEALLENDGVSGVAEPSGCGPKSAGGKRKPCKDCSCGLADMDGNPNPPAQPPSSGCGSCNLGDAFRCASCPYLGLPPFKAGEKVQVPTSLMTSDI